MATTEAKTGLRESPNCLGCGEPLAIENAWMHDGCPCNSPDGCNDLNRTRWKLLGDLQQQQARMLEIYKSAKPGHLFAWCVENLKHFPPMEGHWHDDVKRRLSAAESVQN